MTVANFLRKILFLVKQKPAETPEVREVRENGGPKLNVEDTSVTSNVMTPANDDNDVNDDFDDDDDPQTLLKPAFPDGRRVSYGQTQCCNGFNQSGVCNII